MHYLSYFISEKTPLYGGATDTIRITPYRQISKGDNANVQNWQMNNHTSTHIDFPRHFSVDGKTINDYSPDFWFFENVFTLSVSAQPAEIVDLDTATLAKIPSETDFLIIYTGFGKYRHEEIYWQRNMGLAPALAKKLRERCPKLRMVGFDFISLTSFPNRPVGYEAHRKFLLENEILVVEDMKLENMPENIKRLVCVPILVEQTDGCPVTVIAY